MQTPDLKKPADPIESEQPTEAEGTNGKATKPAAARKRKSRAKPKATKPEAAKAAKTSTESKPAKKRVPNPTTVRMDKTGFSALRAYEAAHPELKRGQALSRAVETAVGMIGNLPPIHMRRVASDDLLTLAGIIADSEKVLKKFRRDTIRARLDKTTKERLVADADEQLQTYRDLRLTICKMIGIPITRNLSTDINLSIGALMEQKMANTPKSVQDAYEIGILVLSAFRIDDDSLKL